ncbi:hypothetical protein DFH07DRAFT_1012653, partial [Mycena maculata]
ETIRIVRGKKSQGQKNNPEKKTSGRQPQRRSDRTVMADMERFLGQVASEVNPWASDSESNESGSTTSDSTDGNEEGVAVDDPLNRIGSQRASPAKKEADAKRLDEEHQRLQEEKERQKEEKPRRKEDKKREKQRQKRLAEREPEDQANELQMFGGVDELQRWDDAEYHMHEDEGQGVTDIGNALSACLGSGILVFPSYFRRLANELRTIDWNIPSSEIIGRADAEAVVDLTKANIASRPPWIARAEDIQETVPMESQTTDAIIGPDPADGLQFGDEKIAMIKATAMTMSHSEKLSADDFCLKLVAQRHKLVGTAGPLFVDHLYRVSSLDGWFNCDVVNEWAKHLDSISPPNTKVVQNGFFNQLRTNTKAMVNDAKKLENWWNRFLRGTRKWFKEHETRAIVLPIHIPSHWICAFVDFDRRQLAIFDSLKIMPVKDWKRSQHVKIFELIKEWLHRLFLSLNSGIDWTEWHIDPCPENQPYQVNFFDCGPHTCLLMKYLCYRQTHDIHNLDKFITPPNVKDFRFLASEDESDVEAVSRPIEQERKSPTGSPLTPILPTSPIQPVVLLRRSTRHKEE